MIKPNSDTLLDYSWGRSYASIWYRKLWWRFMPGITIIVNKPEGKFVTDRLHKQFYSSLPEDHYAEWMRNNVGRQGWDWDWAWYSGKLTWGTPDVAIKFRKGKELFATQASLMWG